MRNRILTLFFFGVLTVMAGCQKSEPSGTEDDKPVAGALSGVSVSIKHTTTATTATFSYTIDLGEMVDAPLEYVLRYSINESLAGQSTKTVKLKADENIYTVTGLQFAKVYYYELHLDLYGIKYSVKKDSFTTNPVSVGLYEPEENFDGLVLSGKVNGLSAVDRSEIKAVLYVEGESFDGTQEFPLELREDFSFSAQLDAVDIDSAYKYWVIASQESTNSERSETKIYHTTDPYEESEKAPSSGSAADLSASGAANCYVVPDSGLYKFKLVKGNSNVPVGEVESVRVLWESFGTYVKPSAFELISATSKDGDYAVFEVPQQFKEGNAVIAAYDAQDNILWSWHIWLTADSISGETYYVSSNGAFTDEVAGVVMDRNLGALSKDVNSVEAYGLFYQWGRKDPYLGSANAAGTAFAVSTRSLRVAIVDASMQTIDYTVANPHVFLVGNSRKDWIGEKNNTLWTNSIKTKYDPCPPGWRIPDGGTGLNGVQAGLWAKIGMSAYGKTQMPSSWQSGWKGMMFPVSKTGYSSWYPVAGGIGLDAALKLVGVDGTYWTAAAIGGEHDYVFAMNFYLVEHATTTDYYEYCSTEVPRATGNSVRCCKE